MLNYDNYVLKSIEGFDPLFSFIDNELVMTPWGIKRGPINIIDVIYIGEDELTGVPILSIVVTGAGIRNIYKK